MTGPAYAFAALALIVHGAALADAGRGLDGSAELAAYLQCVPYARERTGVQIYGDARSWWDQAAGRYQRGAVPRPGAVMTFRPSGNMVLGHVAAVSKVINSRTVLLDHANWSPIGGRRGQIERGAKAVDVSPANDWSEVRVWYAPLQDLGTAVWPVAGFIYGERDDRGPFAGQRALASASYSQATPNARKHSEAFSQAFADLGKPAAARPQPRLAAKRAAGALTQRRDPIEAALARYGS